MRMPTCSPHVLAWRRRAASAIAVALALTTAAAAQTPPPVCDPETVGQVACLTAKLCQCIFDTGGSLVARPPAYRWDCSVLRPNCGAAATAPVTTQQQPGQAPVSGFPPFGVVPVIIDRGGR